MRRAAGCAPASRTAFAIQRHVRAHPDRRRRVWIHLRRAVRLRRPSRRAAPHRRARKLGWRQAIRGRISAGVLAAVRAPSARGRDSFRGARIRFYQDDADRRRVWGRTEWPIVRDVRAGAEVAWQSSSLAGQDVEARSFGADVVVDTRVDPLMPHNAIFVRSAVERLRFSSTSTAVRTEIDANGYVGLYRGIVLALRAVREDFSRPAPFFYKSILGGSRNLRGFRAGSAVGDTLVAGSVGAADPDDVAAADGEIRIQRLHRRRHDLRQRAALRRSETGEGSRRWNLGDRSAVPDKPVGRTWHRIRQPGPYRRRPHVLGVGCIDGIRRSARVSSRRRL